jgi:hypothetical protein
VDLPNETTPEPTTAESTALDSSELGTPPTEDAMPFAPVLPTMTDLDRLAADLDQVDRTLADLDGAPAS